MLGVAAAAMLLPCYSAPLPADELSRDNRFSAPLSCRADAAITSDFIEEISKKLNVPLSATAETGDSILILRAEGKPAYEVLSKIASHNGWEWRREREGYVLVKSAEAKKDETTRLRAEILASYKDFRDRAKRILARKPGDSKDKGELEALSKKLAEMITARADFGSQETRALNERISELTESQLAVGMLMNQIVSDMTDDDIMFLDAHQKIVYSTAPTKLQRPMSREAAKLANEAAHEFLGGYPPEQDERMPTAGSLVRLLGNRDAGEIAAIRAVVTRYQPAGITEQPLPSVSVHLLGAGGEVIARNLPMPTIFGVGLLEMQPTPSKELSIPMKENDGLRALLQPSLRYPRYAKLTEDVANEFSRPRAKTHPAKAAALALNAIAENAGYCLIADPYPFQPLTSNPTFASVWLAIGRTLGKGFDITFDDGWITVRAQRRALSSAENIKPSLLFAIRDKCCDGEVTLDDLAFAADRLTERQSRSALLLLAQCVSRPFTERGGGALLMLRVYGGLSQSSKMILKSGGSVSYGTMSPQSKSAYEEIVYRARFTPMLNISAGPERALVEKLWGPQDGAQMFGKDYESTQLFPSGPLLDSEFSLKRISSPGMLMSYSFLTFEMNEAGYADFTLDDADRQSQSVTLSSGETNFFIVAAAPNLFEGEVVRTYKLGKSYGAFSGLPQEVRLRIEEHYKELRKRRK